MDILHCRHLYGFILFLVLFHFSLFGLASNIGISYDARGIRINGDQKRFLTNSPQHGKELVACTNQEPDLGPLTHISCNEPGYVIAKINFADYGNPTGTCGGHFRRGSCGSTATMKIVKKNCLGKWKCHLFVTDEMFGPSHCKGAPKLAVETTCIKT